MNATTKGLMTSVGLALMTLTSFGPAAAQGGNLLHTTVTVENTRDVPVVVYLERGAFDIRLGTVNPHQKQRLELPKTLEEGEDVQIFVHPEGGIDLATQDLRITRGENLEVLVPSNEVGYVPEKPAEMIPNPGEGMTTLTVENDRSVPVTVFIQEGEFDTRIGTVAANAEQTLNIPKRLSRESPTAEVFVHPEGQGDLASWYLTLKPGAHLFVKVPV